MQIKTTLKFELIPVRMVKIINKTAQLTANVDKDVGKEEVSSLWVVKKLTRETKLEI